MYSLCNTAAGKVIFKILTKKYVLIMTAEHELLWLQSMWFFTKKIQRDATVCQFFFIFIRSSTCFGRHTAHHQEPKTALAASGFA